MLAALHSWNAGQQVGLELATVQMTPGSLFTVVVDAGRLTTLRAHKRGCLRIIVHENANGLLDNVQFDASNLPGGLKPQDMTVEFGIVHDTDSIDHLPGNPQTSP